MAVLESGDAWCMVALNRLTGKPDGFPGRDDRCNGCRCLGVMALTYAAGEGCPTLPRLDRPPNELRFIANCPPSELPGKDVCGIGNEEE